MLDVIEERRSIRAYLDRPVEDEKLMAVLEAARQAPSGNNKQPWGFIVIKSQEQREAVCHADHDQTWMLSAPVFVAVVADLSQRQAGSEGLLIDEDSSQMEVKKIIRDGAIACAHILLEAQHQGLGCCWTGFYNQADMRAVLQTPPNTFIVGVLTLGYADGTPEAKPRRSMADLLHYERWGA